MIINTSTNAYSQMQNTSGVADKKVSLQPVQANGIQNNTSSASGLVTLSGRGLMMSRLFGDSNANPPVQTQLTKDTMAMKGVNFLTESDRNMLSDLYAKAQQDGVDLRYVDDIARDMGDYRMFSGVMANLNNGNFYDDTGHRLTYKFTEEDTSVANRILNGNGTASSPLDSGFLKYELDPGFSPTHRAHFDFLEEAVNKSGSGEPFDSRFSSYQQVRNDRFVVETDSEVTLQTEEPDWGSVDGVFYVTEKGMKNGFRLEGGKVVQDPVAALQNPSDRPKTLLDYFLNREKSDEQTFISLFDYLSSGLFAMTGKE
ncbi:hypothetical protein [Citrobacter sp. RHB35-C17]|uniref:hypothetical protein n=1 Tax=Citrobacter sp. RHB35-C17 TaxID=2742625 RepID=UPI002016E7FE|nr:hypothetical protein [Citrobacter sp. RHB35-C17]